MNIIKVEKEVDNLGENTVRSLCIAINSDSDSRKDKNTYCYGYVTCDLIFYIYIIYLVSFL